MIDKIDLGCGPIYREGFLRADFSDEFKPDVLFDLNVIPWPLPDNHFAVIYSSHVIEHLPDINPFLREAIRISKHGCRFRFEFPHYSVYAIEPGHLRGYGLHALEYFKEFRTEERRLEWSPGRDKGRLYSFLDSVITSLANVNPFIAERLWCYWVGGFSNVVLKGWINKEFFKDNSWFRK